MENKPIRTNFSSLAQLQNSAMAFDRAVLKPVFVGEHKVEDTHHFAVWNEDKEKVSAIVSERYNLVQHQHIVSEVATALQNLNMNCDARVSNGGDVMFVDLTFKDFDISFETKGLAVGESFFAGLQILNSYNKTTGVIVKPRLLRKVCTNGMVLDVGSAFAKTINLVHTNKLAEDFAQYIPALIKEMVNSSDKLRILVEKNIADSIEWESMKIIVKTLIKTEKHADKIWDILRREEVEGRMSKWSLYNSITDYATHNSQLTPLVEQMLQNKAQLVLTTPLAQLMPKMEVV